MAEYEAAPGDFAGAQWDRIIPGDAREKLAELPGGIAQAIIADPPYFHVLQEEWDTQWESVEEFLSWCVGWVRECMRVLKDDGLFFCFGQPGKREHAFLHLMSRLCLKWKFHDLIIWDRVVGYNERQDSLTPSYEMILVLRKGESPKFFKDALREEYTELQIARYMKDKRYKDKEARRRHLHKGKYATNILSVPSLKGSSREKCGHPSQKPLELIRKLVRCASAPGDLVIDPFMGSGTTAVAARQEARHWLGIERAPDYVRMARQRIAKDAEAYAPASVS